MCDYSLHHVKSRPAKVGDKLKTRNFGTGTRGFAGSDDPTTAVCVLPGTELAFADEVHLLVVKGTVADVEKHASVAVFRQINREFELMHHDALEFPDGSVKLLHDLIEGQEATVLQLPAAPRNEAEKQAQTRLATAG